MQITITPTPNGDGWDVELDSKIHHNVTWKKVAGLVSNYVDEGVRLSDPRWCYWCDRGKRDCACEDISVAFEGGVI